jgi:hypothetical protein
MQSKAKVPCASALASLRECIADRKLGSKAKHALKDLAMHRLTLYVHASS